MNVMYYFHKLHVAEQLGKYDLVRRWPSLTLLEKILNRCIKLYDMVGDFMKIYKLIACK